MGGFKFTSEEVPKVKSLVAAPDYLSQPNQEKVRRLWMASKSYQKLTPDQQVDFVRQLDQRLRSRQPKAEPAPVPQGFDLKTAQAKADAEFKAAHTNDAAPPPQPTSEGWMASAMSGLSGLFLTAGEPPPVPKPPTINKESLDAEGKQVDVLQSQVKKLGQDLDSDKEKLTPQNAELKKSWDSISKESKEIDEEVQKANDIDEWLGRQSATITAHHNAGTETKEEIDQYNDAVLQHRDAVDSLHERIDSFKQRNAARNESIAKLKGVDEDFKKKIAAFNDVVTKYYVTVSGYNEKAKVLRGVPGQAAPLGVPSAEGFSGVGMGAEVPTLEPLSKEVHERMYSLLKPEEIDKIEKALRIDPDTAEAMKEQFPTAEPHIIPGDPFGSLVGESTAVENFGGPEVFARAAIESLSQWYSPAMLATQGLGHLSAEATREVGEMGENVAPTAKKAYAAWKAAEKAGSEADKIRLSNEGNRLIEEAYRLGRGYENARKFAAAVRTANAAVGAGFTVDQAANAVRLYHEGKYGEALSALGSAVAIGFLTALGAYGIPKMMERKFGPMTAPPRVEYTPPRKGLAGEVPVEAPKPSEGGTKPPPTPSAQPQTPSTPSPEPKKPTPAPSVAPAPEIAKEPYEMPFDEFLAHQVKIAGYQAPPVEWGDLSAQRAQHQEAIKEALDNGESIPAKVLQEYPGIGKETETMRDYPKAVKLAQKTDGKITVTGIQRSLGVSYEQAQRLMGRLREEGHLVSAATPPPEPKSEGPGPVADEISHLEGQIMKDPRYPRGTILSIQHQATMGHLSDEQYLEELKKFIAAEPHLCHRSRVQDCANHPKRPRRQRLRRTFR